MDAAAQRELDQVMAHVEAERTTGDALRERVKVLDRAQRVVAMQLGQVHTLPPSESAYKCPPLTPVASYMQSAVQAFSDVRTAVVELSKDIPVNEFYRVRIVDACALTQWCDTWTWAMRNAVHCASLAYYLETGRLLPKDGAASILGSMFLQNICLYS